MEEEEEEEGEDEDGEEAMNANGERDREGGMVEVKWFGRMDERSAVLTRAPLSFIHLTYRTLWAWLLCSPMPSRPSGHSLP